MAASNEENNDIPMNEPDDEEFKLVDHGEYINDNLLRNSDLYTSLVSESQVKSINNRVYPPKNIRKASSLDREVNQTKKNRLEVTENAIMTRNKTIRKSRISTKTDKKSSTLDKKSEYPASDNSSKQINQQFQHQTNRQLLNFTNSQSFSQQNSKASELPPTPPVAAILRYDRTDKAPFLVHIKQDDQSQKPKSLIEITRILRKCDIDHNLIEFMSRGTWLLTFDQYDEANKIIDNYLVKNHGYSTFIPRERERVSRKCVVRGIAKDVTKEEFIEEVNSFNPSLKVLDMYRFTRRIQGENGPERTETETVCFTIKGANLPPYIVLFATRSKITPYIPSIRQCYRCGKIGHISRFCKEEEKCLTCGESKHEESLGCSKPPKCRNCQGAHRTIYKDCEEIIKAKEISKIMAYENLPFIQTRRKYEGRSSVMSSAPTRTIENFPQLNSRTQTQVQENVTLSSFTSQKWGAKSNSSAEKVRKYLKELKTPRVEEVSQASKEEISNLVEIIKNIPDQESFWQRIWKTAELHLTHSYCQSGSQR